MAANIFELRDVHFLRDGRAILTGVDWTVAPGEHWAIVGANGSGKTTLLRLATGYLWPTRGAVGALGARFGTVDLRELRKRIGWVSSALSEMIHRGHAAADIVVAGASASTGMFAKPTAGQLDKAHHLLAELDCERIADSRFGVLSLGEQQKVLIARALMAAPEVLILDEACAGLDLRTREHLLATIDALARRGDITLILVTHHIEEITPAFSHVLVLDNGAVAAAGPAERVLTGRVLSKAMRIDVDIHRHNGRYWPRIQAAPTKTAPR